MLGRASLRLGSEDAYRRDKALNSDRTNCLKEMVGRRRKIGKALNWRKRSRESSQFMKLKRRSYPV